METETPALPPLPRSNRPDSQPQPAPPRRRGFLAGLVIGIVGTGLVGFAIGASMPAAHAALGAMAHRGFASEDGRGGPSPEEIRDHAEFFVGFALHRLDATAEQEERVQKIVDDALTGLMPVAARHRANRDSLHEILKAPTVDRAAIEKLRGEEMAEAEALSRILADTIAGAADVLTVEQRTALVDHLERFRRRG